MDGRENFRRILKQLPQSAFEAIKNQRIEGSFKFNDKVSVVFDGRFTKTITVIIQPPGGGHFQYKYDLDEFICHRNFA